VQISLKANKAKWGWGTGPGSTEDHISGFENVIGSRHADTIEGSAGNNRIEGGAGNDALKGNDGDDTLIGGAGGDALDGGAGTDWASYENAGSGVTASLKGFQFGSAEGDALGDTYNGIESLLGSAHNDRLVGDNGANHIKGNPGDDILMGGAGNDTLDGGANGNDTLDGGAGADTFLFGSQWSHDSITDFEVGVDRLLYIHGDPSRLDFTASKVDAGVSVTWGQLHSSLTFRDKDLAWWATAEAVLFGVVPEPEVTPEPEAEVTPEPVNMTKSNNHYDHTGAKIKDYWPYLALPYGHRKGIGSNGDDRAGYSDFGTGAGYQFWYGFGGNDYVNANQNGFKGWFQGGSGTDTIDYSFAYTGVNINLLTNKASFGTGPRSTEDHISGFENVIGSRNNDHIIGDSNDNSISGGSGNDVLEGRDGDDTLLGGNGNDSLEGGKGDDALLAGKGNDTLDGGAGSDWADYSDGFTGITVRLDHGTATYGSGSENYQDTLHNFENAQGSRHNDSIVGDDGANHLKGNPGDDTLTGGAGADTLDGGAGSDTASYAASSAGVNVNLGTGTASGGHATGDVLNGIENLIGSDHADALTGNSGANHLTGGAGNDTLTGGAGADTLDGGAGTDTASYAGADAGIVVNLGHGRGYDGAALNDYLKNIENLRGSSHGDVIIGDAGNNRLEGGAGNDVIGGDAGDDALQGQAGNDVLEGSTGADTLNGGTGTDTASYARSDAGVAVNLGQGTASGGHATGDVLSSIENLIGSGHADYLVSNVVASLLDGHAGADTLRGGGAADTLTGGAGDDRLWGHQGDDRLTGGADHDRLDGGADHDRLDGGTGHDTLEGGAGQDTIIGRSGNDVLTGGADRDVFLFKDNFGTDVITDFEDGIDRILIRTDGVRFKDLSITGTGTDVDRAAVVSWGAEGDSITLEGVDHTDLTRADFIFW